MRTNLDHDIFSKKAQSLALEAEVAKFLKAQGKEEPEQIPFGHSELAHKRETEGYNAQSTMREIMFSSVQESKKNKSAVKPAQAPSPERLRRDANNAARIKAVAEGKSQFQGQCAHHGQQTFKIKSKGEEHICIICRDNHSVKQTIKRRKKQVAA
ncbi:hypothetical protein ABBZ27_00270 [Acinetobacter baumannii]|uniref:hypothetical protein n=1 Tax=Acinetobacter baumannii TaxID=470 RepID=UPI0002B9C041|nr:hypothetical protein [Acinetobacter baumannii]